jgi:hypothetical protein
MEDLVLPPDQNEYVIGTPGEQEEAQQAAETDDGGANKTHERRGRGSLQRTKGVRFPPERFADAYSKLPRPDPPASSSHPLLKRIPRPARTMRKQSKKKKQRRRRKTLTNPLRRSKKKSKASSRKCVLVLTDLIEKKIKPVLRNILDTGEE